MKDSAPGATAAGKPGAVRTIAVVEDEPTVLVLEEAIIAELGHATLTAANGNEAVALVEHGEAFDVLVTDIDLGDGPDGLVVARLAYNRNPALKIVYASGQLMTDGMRSLMVEGSRFLKKPFTPEELQEAVTAALVG